MTTNTVWHPQKSFANDGSEEGGRGSFVSTDQDHDSQQQQQKTKPRTKAIIPRRRTPTIDVSVLVSYAAAAKKNNHCKAKDRHKTRDTYDTIESGEGPGILDCSSVVYRKKPQLCSTTDNELCGWRDKEFENYRELADKSTTFSSFDRSRLHNPAEGVRSNLQSRAGRRSAAPSSRGRRKEAYVFQHFNEVQDYIDHYRLHHSYTTLTVPALKTNMCTARAVDEGLLQDNDPPVVEQDSVKSYDENDPYSYLRELVSRLGVKALVQNGHKPTPPSIVKKSKNDEDLVVYSNGGNMNKGEEVNSIDHEGPIFGGNNSHQNSPPATTKQVARCEGQSETLELPKIAPTAHIPAHQRRGQSTNSVISVNKYLQVTSQQQQPTNVQEESREGGGRDGEETDIKTSSQDCLPQLPNSGTSLISASTEHIVQGEHLNGYHNAVEFNTPNSATIKKAAQEQLMMLDSSQKEKLLTNKAHSLGLTSRDWARSSKAKRMLGSCKTRRGEEEGTPIRASTQRDQRSNYRQTVMSRPQTRLSRPQTRLSRPQTRLSRPHTRMATAVMDQTKTSSGSRMDRSRAERPITNHVHRYNYPTADVEGGQDKRQKRESGDDLRQTSAKPNQSRKPRGEEDGKKLEQLKDIYDSSRRNERDSVSSRCPTRQRSRCGRNVGTSSSRPVTRQATSSCEEKKIKKSQRKTNHSRPVTQLGRSRGRPFIMKGVVDYARLNLDESCCWNEIPRKTDSHSAEIVQSSEPMDFDLDDIMLRAKHRSLGGVAMVTVRLRHRTGKLNKHSHRSADDQIVPGASPKEVVEHTARINRKFDGIFNVQRPLTST